MWFFRDAEVLRTSPICWEFSILLYLIQAILVPFIYRFMSLYLTFTLHISLCCMYILYWKYATSFFTLDSLIYLLSRQFLTALLLPMTFYRIKDMSGTYCLLLWRSMLFPSEEFNFCSVEVNGNNSLPSGQKNPEHFTVDPDWSYIGQNRTVMWTLSL